MKHLRPTSRIALAIGLCLLTMPTTTQGFVIFGSWWNDGSITMRLQLQASRPAPDVSRSFDDVAAAALSTWNRHLDRVQFHAVSEATPRGNDGDFTNQVFFDNSYYGESFGQGTLAITTRWTMDGTERVEADVIFNTAINWNAYTGPLRTENGRIVWDLGRVALHEFGHVLGLNHPDEHGQRVDALMNSLLGDRDTLAADDIAGARSLYGFDNGASDAVSSRQVRQFIDRLNLLFRVLSLLNGKIPNSTDQWTAEYLRYRRNGCGHDDATRKVFQQVLGRAAPPTC